MLPMSKIRYNSVKISDFISATEPYNEKPTYFQRKSLPPRYVGKQLTNVNQRARRKSIPSKYIGIQHNADFINGDNQHKYHQERIKKFHRMNSKYCSNDYKQKLPPLVAPWTKEENISHLCMRKRNMRKCQSTSSLSRWTKMRSPGNNKRMELVNLPPISPQNPQIQQQRLPTLVLPHLTYMHSQPRLTRLQSV